LQHLPATCKIPCHYGKYKDTITEHDWIDASYEHLYITLRAAFCPHLSI